jgi:hypothetical protein
VRSFPCRERKPRHGAILGSRFLPRLGGGCFSAAGARRGGVFRRAGAKDAGEVEAGGGGLLRNKVALKLAWLASR